jgi:hypothetical protein
MHLPGQCANFVCPNKPHEGQFILLETEGDAVGGHRPIRLWMCHPCAAALVNGPTKPAADNWPSSSAQGKSNQAIVPDDDNDPHRRTGLGF